MSAVDNYWSAEKKNRNSQNRPKKGLKQKVFFARLSRHEYFKLIHREGKLQKKVLLLMAGGLGLNGPPIKRRTFFCGFPKTSLKNVDIFWFKRKRCRMFWNVKIVKNIFWPIILNSYLHKYLFDTLCCVIIICQWYRL